MDKETCIEYLRILQGMIEWDYSMDFCVALDYAIDYLAEEKTDEN